MSGRPLVARLHDTWSDDRLQLARLRPESGFATLLDWHGPDLPIDCGVPEDFAQAIARALARLGLVAFRWAGPATWSASDVTVLRAQCRGVTRAIGRVFGHVEHDLILSRDPSVVAALFDFTWEYQGQAVLVVTSATGLDAEARHDLSTRSEWRDYVIAPPVQLFMAPIVDGDGMVFVTSTAGGLREVEAGLRVSFAEQGIAVEP